MISQTARFVRGLATPLALLILAGCASSGPTPDTQMSGGSVDQVRVEKPGANDRGSRAAAVALQQVGVPYRYGGTSPNGFDCSGLVHYSYARAGTSVPRTTATLWSGLRPVASSDLRAGDILFFRIAGKMSHVGMYIGDNEFVHAPSSGKRVSIESLRSDFYADAFIRAGRPN